jgi:hypothetical protein
MSYRFTDHSKTTIVNTETGATLEWDPVRSQIVSDHGFAGEAYRAAGSPQPESYKAPEPAKTPDDFARRTRRGAGEDRRRP